MSALDRQPGGSHYKDKAIQPVQYTHANGLGFCEGNVVKYISRWREKGGIKDLRKAQHYIDLLIELEGLDDKKTYASHSDPTVKDSLTADEELRARATGQPPGDE